MKKYTDTGKKDTRSGFGAGLAQDGKIPRGKPYPLFPSGNC